MGLGLALAAAVLPGVRVPGLADDQSRPLATLERIAEQAAPVPCQAAEPIMQRGVVASSPLLDRLDGFAKVAGVTGGLGMPLFTVTDYGDAPPGVRLAPGTLRAVLQQARLAGGGWIRFAGSGGRIVLDRPVEPPDNVTFDGGCSRISLTSRRGGVMILRAATNMIVTRLSIDGREQSLTGGGDCITVAGADRVWIAYNQLSQCQDGLIDIVRRDALGAASRVTVAYNLLRDHDKAMLVGTLDCSHGPAAAACPDFANQPWSWQRGVQLSLHDNLFLRTGQRNPKVSGLGYADMYRNILLLQPSTHADGRPGALYGAYASNGGRISAHDNLIAVGTSPGGRRAFWADTGAQPRVQKGLIRMARNQLPDGANIDAGGGNVPDPPYRAAGGLPADPAAAVRMVAAHAGPSGY